MTHSAATASLAETPTPLSDNQLAWLSRTYERVSQPIWVHDLTNRCIYRNRPARSAGRHSAARLVFEIIDHNGRTIGHLATLRS